MPNIVPATYPKEPNAKRCGDTYDRGVFVDGEIPGAQFGKQFKRSINPILFPYNDGSGIPKQRTTPALFVNRANLDAEIADLNDRLQATKDAQVAHAKYFSKQSADSLKWLLLVVEDLRSWARQNADQIQKPKAGAKPSPNDPGGFRHAARDRIEEALPFLRCAEYWTWRIILHGQALQEYKREPGIGLTSAGSVAGVALPPSPGAALPPVDKLPPPSAEQPPPPEPPPEGGSAEQPPPPEPPAEPINPLWYVAIGVVVLAAVLKR